MPVSWSDTIGDPEIDHRGERLAGCTGRMTTRQPAAT